MSLFDDPGFEYRETFFVFFRREHRPTAVQMKKCLSGLGNRYQITHLIEDEDGLDSVRVSSPYDFSAMDIVYLEGDEVTSQIKDVLEEFRTMTLVKEEAEKVRQLKGCNARFDVYHFEQTARPGQGAHADQLDPGGLLLVLDKLSDLCRGIGYDPQSTSML